MADLTKLTKLQLEALGREYDIELDRRLTKAKLVEQLDAHIKWCACGKTEDPNGVCDGSHAKTLVDLKSEEAEVEETPKFSKATDEVHARAYNYREVLNVEFSDEQEAKAKARKYGGFVVSKKPNFIVVK